MNYNLKDFQEASAKALFSAGDTVTIKVYDKDDVDVTPDSPDDECTPYGELDTFKWDYSTLAEIPTTFQEYSWVMINQSGTKKRDADPFSSHPLAFLSIPFDVDLSTKSINKGDTFEPEFRIDTNVQDLEVRIEFSDMETYIYKGTSNVADRGDGVAGGIDQVKLTAEDLDGAFQIFKVYLSGDETVTFDSRYVDMKITATTPDNKTQTIKKKVPFSITPAIGFDTVP